MLCRLELACLPPTLALCTFAAVGGSGDGGLAGPTSAGTTAVAAGATRGSIGTLVKTMVGTVIVPSSCVRGTEAVLVEAGGAPVPVHGACTTFAAASLSFVCTLVTLVF